MEGCAAAENAAEMAMWAAADAAKKQLEEVRRAHAEELRAARQQLADQRTAHQEELQRLNPNHNPNPRWLVLRPVTYGTRRAVRRGVGTQRSCRRGSNSRQEAGSQLGVKKNRTFARSVYREGGPPASKDYTIALV